MRILTNLTFGNIMQTNRCRTLTFTQSHTRIISAAIIITCFIVMNNSRFIRLKIVRKLLQTFIKLVFINSFITSHGFFHTGKNSIPFVFICDIDFIAFYFCTNIDNFCLFILLGKTITDYIGHIIVNIRNRTCNTCKCFRYTIVNLFITSATIIIDSFKFECGCNPFSIFIVSTSTKIRRNCLIH